MLETLRHIVQEVNAARGLNEALQITVRRVCEAMNTQVCSVYMRDLASGCYVFQATQGLNPELVGMASLAEGEGLIGLVAERGEPVNLEEAENHPNFQFLSVSRTISRIFGCSHHTPAALTGRVGGAAG